jgi:hypothetical protein
MITDDFNHDLQAIVCLPKGLNFTVPLVTVSQPWIIQLDGIATFITSHMVQPIHRNGGRTRQCAVAGLRSSRTETTFRTSG